MTASDPTVRGQTMVVAVGEVAEVEEVAVAAEVNISSMTVPTTIDRIHLTVN